MKVPIRYTPVSWGSPSATLASMEDVMSDMGGESACTSSEDLLQEELWWEPGENPPSPPPSPPPPPDPHLHQKVEPLRMAVLTNINPQQTLTDSDDDLQNSQPPNLHGKVRGLLSGMKKVVMRVKSPQGVQGGASTLVLQSPVTAPVPGPVPAPAPAGLRASAPAPAPSPAPRTPATPPVAPQRCWQCVPCLRGNCRQYLAKLRAQGPRGQHAASQFEDCINCATNSRGSCIGKSACLTWNEEQTALYNRMVQYRAQALRANLGATRTPGPGPGAQAQDQAQTLGPEPQPVLRPGVPDNTPLPEEEVPPPGSTDDNLQENTVEERVGAQGGIVEGLPSPLPPPQSPPSADQIMSQMVTTLTDHIERVQSALEHFREIYNTDQLEADIQGMTAFLRSLPRADQRALSQFQLMEVARFTTQLRGVIDGCENIFTYGRRDHTVREVDNAVFQVLRLRRRQHHDNPVSHSTPPPQNTAMHPPPSGGHSRDVEGAHGGRDSSLHVAQFPTEWDDGMQWGSCPGRHPMGGCSDRANGGAIHRWSTMGERPTHISYTETPRVARTQVHPGARSLATPLVRPRVPQPLGNTVGATRAPGCHPTGGPPYTTPMPAPYTTGSESTRLPAPFPSRREGRGGGGGHDPGGGGGGGGAGDGGDPGGGYGGPPRGPAGHGGDDRIPVQDLLGQELLL